MSTPFQGRSRAIAAWNHDDREWKQFLRNGGCARIEALRQAFAAETERRSSRPTPPPEAFEAPSVALLDRIEPGPVDVVAEENEETGALSIRPLADFDDAIRNLDTDPRQLWLNDAEHAWREIAQRDTGDIADPEKRKKTLQRKRELLELSIDTANDLEAEGAATCYRQDEMVIWMQGTHTGIVHEVPRFNSILMLPYVAAQKRQRFLTAADYFLQSRPFARTAVFTTGPRTKLQHLNGRIRELHRNLSKLNAEIRDEFRVEIALRSTELGGVEIDESGETIEAAGEIERDQDGDPTFHVHSHVIMHHVDGEPMSWDRWTNEFLPFVAKRWGWWWKDLGTLRNAAETVKYITKPREVSKLTQQEKAELYRQIHGLHLIQAMGALQAEMKSRKERYMRLDRTPTKDGRIIREVRDWNRWRRRRALDAVSAAIETVCAHGGDPFRVKDDDRPVRGERHEGERREVDVEPRCVAILPPMFMAGSLVREPVAVFYGKRVDRLAALKDPRCRKVREWTGGRLAALALWSTHAHQLSAPQAGQMVCIPAISAVGPPDG